MKHLPKIYHLFGVLVCLFLAPWIAIVGNSWHVEKGVCRFSLYVCALYVATNIVIHTWSILKGKDKL